MRSWVKHPVGFSQQIAARIPAGEVRFTAQACFELARRRDPHRGYLVTDTLQPLTVRALAAAIGLTKSSVQRHLEILTAVGYLVRDLAGWMLVPLVFEIERELNARTTTVSAMPTETERKREHGGENGAPRDVQKNAPIMSLVPPANENAPPWDNDSLVFIELDRLTLRNVRQDFSEQAFPQGDFSLGSAVSDLPDTISLPDVRYLLAKLRRTTPAWHGFPSRVRDVALIERLEATAPGALCTALQQEALAPTAKNPGAWLARTVSAIAGGGDVGTDLNRSRAASE